MQWQLGVSKAGTAAAWHTTHTDTAAFRAEGLTAATLLTAVSTLYL